MIHNGIDYPYIDKILLSEEQIEEIVKRLSAQISADYANDTNQRLVLLCILKGSVVFMGDLMKHITAPVEIDFMRVSSYVDGTTSTGNINIILDLHRKDLKESDILIVEDIIDSFDTEYFNYIQGATYHNGKIYSLEGFTDNATNRPALRIVDLKTKTVETVDLYGMNLKIEPEIVYVYNGAGYYVDVSGNVYEFPIN